MSEIASVHGLSDIAEADSRRGGSVKSTASVCSSCQRRTKCTLASVSSAGSPLEEGIYEAGMSVFTENDHFDSVYVVKSGSLQILATTANGEQAIIGFVFPGAVVGSESEESDRYPYTITALEKSRLCAVDKKTLLSLMRVNPDFQLRLLRTIGSQIVQDKKSMLTLFRGTVEAKTAAFVLYLYSRYHNDKYISSDIVLSMPRSAISGYLGITPESLSRCLSSLSKKGAIAVFNRRLSILDMDKLRVLALDCNVPYDL